MSRHDPGIIPRLRVESMDVVSSISNGFDASSLYAALDGRRVDGGLTWSGVAKGVWDLSCGLNALRPGDHPFSTSSIARLREHGEIGCQHALLLVWWLDASPEDFVRNPDPATIGVCLPACDTDHRLRWQIKRLFDTLDAARARRGVTWAQLAERLGCTPGQLTGLRTASYSTNMRLALGITQLLRRPTADFVHAASW